MLSFFAPVPEIEKDSSLEVEYLLDVERLRNLDAQLQAVHSPLIYSFQIKDTTINCKTVDDLIEKIGSLGSEARAIQIRYRPMEGSEARFKVGIGERISLSMSSDSFDEVEKVTGIVERWIESIRRPAHYRFLAKAADSLFPLTLVVALFFFIVPSLARLVLVIARIPSGGTAWWLSSEAIGVALFVLLLSIATSFPRALIAIGPIGTRRERSLQSRRNVLFGVIGIGFAVSVLGSIVANLVTR